MISEKYCGARAFILVKLLQTGATEDYLVSQGYDIKEIKDCEKIRNYLFVCYENARLEEQWKK